MFSSQAVASLQAVGVWQSASGLWCACRPAWAFRALSRMKSGMARAKRDRRHELQGLAGLDLRRYRRAIVARISTASIIAK